MTLIINTGKNTGQSFYYCLKHSIKVDEAQWLTLI